MPNAPTPRPDVEGIEARAKAATAGPWIEGQPGNFRIYGPANMGRQSGPLFEGLGVNDNEILRANVSFIAHTRQDIPALITWIEALEDENKKLHLLADNLATLANVKPDLDGEGDG